MGINLKTTYFLGLIEPEQYKLLSTNMSDFGSKSAYQLLSKENKFLVDLGWFLWPRLEPNLFCQPQMNLVNAWLSFSSEICSISIFFLIITSAIRSVSVKLVNWLLDFSCDVRPYYWVYWCMAMLNVNKFDPWLNSW